MAIPLDSGVPGGMELAIILLLLAIPLGFADVIATDAGKRGSAHTLAWGIFAFVNGITFWGILIMGVFYWFVRDDIGEST